jgi:hypothetical protein
MARIADLPHIPQLAKSCFFRSPLTNYDRRTRLNSSPAQLDEPFLSQVDSTSAPALEFKPSMMRHPSYVVFSFLAAVAVVLPLPWHWRAKNVATISIIFWLLSANLVILVNAIIWADNYDDLSPIWCDICKSLCTGWQNHWAMLNW